MQSGITSAVSNQVMLMAIYIAVGFVFTKLKMFSQKSSKQMTDLLLYIVTPCVIVKAFQDGYEADSASKLAVAFLLAIGFHVMMVLLTKLIYIKSKNKDRAVVDRFSISFSNCGFMGIPLLEAALGPEGVFAGSAYLAVFNVFVWTQGYKMFNSGNGKISYVKVFLNPGVIGVTLSAILVFSGIRLPSIATTAINGMSALNTPVAMVLLGIYLAETNLKVALSSLSLYGVCILRLIAMPLVIIGVMWLLKVEYMVAFATILSGACPCATISAIFAAQFGKNSGYASSVVAVSTVLSLVTLPFVAYVASTVLL